MRDPDDEELIQQILRVLELDHQYRRLVEAWNHDLIAQIRRCGRAAGRRLGYRSAPSRPTRSVAKTDEWSSGWSSPSPPPTTPNAYASAANC
jgi:hypothetical protein